MKREHIIRMVAGTLVLLGVALHHWVNRYWLLLPIFVGLNLVQSSLTKWCLMEDLLRRFKIGTD
jgi:hypothetical protein